MNAEVADASWTARNTGEPLFWGESFAALMRNDEHFQFEPDS
jgi:hypothetical protein